MEATVRGCHAAPVQSQKQASGGPTPDACFATRGRVTAGYRLQAKRSSAPALGVWCGRQEGFPMTGYCILAKQQQAAAARLVANQ